MDIEWVVGVLRARGYRIEKLQTESHNRVLFKIDELFLFPEELHGLAVGDYSLEELKTLKNPMDYLK